MKTKICRGCGTEKPCDIFGKNRATCKECRKTARIEYLINNKNMIKIQQAEYYKENKEYIIDQTKKYQKENIDKIKSYENKRRDKKLKYRKEYYLNNKEKQIAYQKIHRQKDKKEIRERQKKYDQKRSKDDPAYKFRRNISTTIYIFLKRNMSSKNGRSCSQFLPFTFEELKQHLESQFEHWMTWDNHGKYNIKTWEDNDQTTWTWQLDHIVPHSTFNYISMDCQEFKDCWSLSNLRPLSAKQNVIDGNRR